MKAVSHEHQLTIAFGQDIICHAANGVIGETHWKVSLFGFVCFHIPCCSNATEARSMPELGREALSSTPPDTGPLASSTAI